MLLRLHELKDLVEKWASWSRKVEVELPMPPTSNNIYTRAHGKRIMTSEARSWKRKGISEICRSAKLGIQSEFNPDSMYFLVMHFYFEDIFNKGWFEVVTKGERKGEPKASKWKKIDLSNRIKLAEDTLKAAVGVDDCATFAHVLVKDCDPDNPRLVMTLYETTDE